MSEDNVKDTNVSEKDQMLSFVSEMKQTTNKKYEDYSREAAANISKADPKLVQRIKFKVHEVDLPSGGKVYPPDHPLFLNGGVVEIRQMTAADEDILNDRQAIKKNNVLENLLRECITKPEGLNIDDLIAADKMMILVALRVTGIGAEYKVNLECASCEKEFPNTYMLNKMEVRRLNENVSLTPVEETGINRFKFKTPSGYNVEIKLLNGNEEKMLEQQAEMRQKKGVSQRGMTVQRMMYIIQSIDGETDKGKIKDMLDLMNIGDSKFIREMYNEISPEIKFLDNELMCPHCYETNDYSIPIGIGFFWPELAK